MVSAADSGKRRAKDADKPSSKKSRTSTGGSATLRVPSADAPIGPVLASFADFAPPKDTRFSLYCAPSDAASDEGTPRAAHMDDRLVLAGETRTIQYASGNWGWGAASSAPVDLRREARGYSGEYMLGVYDPEKQTVTLRPVPVFTLGRSVKALAQLSATAIERGTGDALNYTQARRDLGEAFGNKRQKQTARNLDRMKVRTDNMDQVLADVATGIDASVSALPSDAELNAALSASRALPEANLNAEDPAAVYALHALVPRTVLHTLSVQSLFGASSQGDVARRIGPLGKPSPWLLPCIWRLVQALESSTDRSQTKELIRAGYYAAVLVAFRRSARVLSGSDGVASVAQKMRLSEEERDVVMEDLVSRFTERTRTDQTPVMTATCETKLIAHVLAIGLHLEAFRIAPREVAQELGVPTQRVNELLRSLGCSSTQTTQYTNEGDRESSHKERRWTLKLPLSFPNLRRRGPRR